MLTVAVVCVEGGDYGAEHVARIARLVDKHLSQPFMFHVIYDSPWPGFWAKVELFKPGRFTGRVLYIDLDTTPVGPLDDLADFDAPFVAIDDWHRPGLNSSVMAWDAGHCDHIWERFNGPCHTHGDQGWITECMPDAATFPRGQCISYKRRKRSLLPGAPFVAGDMRVVVHHGKPRPWEVDDVE